MKWSKSFRPGGVVRGVSLVPPQPPIDPAVVIRERERVAYAQGLADGEQRLGEQLLRQRNELLELHQGVLRSLQESVAQVCRDAEETLIEFAFEVARKVVAEIPIDRALIEANIRSALAEAEEATEFFIHLHPEDIALLQRHASDSLAEVAQARPMHFIPSPEVSRGGCMVRTKFGLIDARRETRLARIQEALAP
jgi:flagellar assembly protein FliH